jgi:flagellin-like hook-associated protein FlgL
MKNKYKIALTLTFYCLFTTLLSAQIERIKDLPINYENERDTILKLYKGDVVKVTLDSVYLFNQKRFNDVEQLLAFRDFVKNKDPMSKAFSTVWENQNQTFEILEKYINLLRINADKTAQTGEDLAKNTIKIAEAADTKLDAVNQKLTIAQSKLDSANTHLDNAVKLIKQDIRWRWLKNAALVAIGVLLGFFAAK